MCGFQYFLSGIPPIQPAAVPIPNCDAPHITEAEPAICFIAAMNSHAAILAYIITDFIHFVNTFFKYYSLNFSIIIHFNFML